MHSRATPGLDSEIYDSRQDEDVNPFVASVPFRLLGNEIKGEEICSFPFLCRSRMNANC